MPRISVLIPAYNEESLLAATLDCIKSSLKEAGLEDAELIVCDNNSADGTSRVAREAGAQVVFEPHNQIARARNHAAAHAAGEWLLFVDADTRPTPALLLAMLSCIEGGGVCGGGALVRFDTPVAGPGRVLLRWWNALSLRLALAAGCFIFCRRLAWAETGGFDERLYAAEELAFAQRVKRWGRKKGERFVVLSDPPVITSARKLARYGQWRILLQLLPVLLPGALRSRRLCRFWYDRPAPASRHAKGD
jgi:glycosyltransferase involved in cell wall biosynthesis